MEIHIRLLLFAILCSIISIISIIEIIIVKEINENRNLMFLFYIIFVIFGFATYVLTLFASLLHKEYLQRLVIISRQSQESANEIANAL
tara:strand:+ start:2531 stop:2797 length:267 start_codon:yes stop_codon:yes gene_type:complete